MNGWNKIMSPAFPVSSTKSLHCEMLQTERDPVSSTSQPSEPSGWSYNLSGEMLSDKILGQIPSVWARIIPFNDVFDSIRSDVGPAAPRLNVVEEDDDCQCLLSGVEEVPEPFGDLQLSEPDIIEDRSYQSPSLKRTVHSYPGN